MITLIAYALMAAGFFTQAREAHRSMPANLQACEILRDCLDSGLTVRERRNKMYKAWYNAQARVELREHAQNHFSRYGRPFVTVDEYANELFRVHGV